MAAPSCVWHWQTQPGEIVRCGKPADVSLVLIGLRQIGVVGLPEALRENLSGFWSRRIDETNRLVYAADEATLTIISCRYHY